LEVVQRLTARKPRMVRLLGEMASSGEYTHSLYLTPEALRAPGTPGLAEAMLDAVGESDTGAALFWGGAGGVAVAPPFPLRKDEAFERMEAGPLLALLDSRPTVGVVLLRLGRYAVAVLEGDEVLVSKTGSRYVKARHRAGGSSQRRYERSRERLVHELYEAACSVVEGVFVSAGVTLRHGRESPTKPGPDYVLLGGEKHTLAEFTKRCPTLQRLGERLLSRRLPVDRPGNDALEGIADEVWASRVVMFRRSGGLPLTL
jgi:hypothetical protein